MDAGASTLTWHYLHRPREFDAVVAAVDRLSDHAGAILLGAPGVGKTTLARAVVDALGADARWVVGSSVGVEVPLGAFGPLITLAGQRHVLAVLTAARASLADSCRGRVLVVDDAHLLDPLSATLVHQLVLTRSARVVITCRSGAPTLDAITSLWKDGHLARIDLTALTRAQTDELLAAVLGGSIEAATADRIWRASEGNPLIIRGIVSGAAESGSLRQADGVWRLRGPHVLSSEIESLFEARLASMSTEVREVVDLMAFGGPLELGVLRSLVGQAAIETTERCGLIQLGDDGVRQAVRLAHPMIREVVRARTADAAARAVRGRLAEALSTSWAHPVDLIRVGALLLDSDRAADPVLFTRAAQEAAMLANLPLAVRLAGRSWTVGGGFEAGLVLVTALMWQSRGAEAEQVLAALEPTAESEVCRHAMAHAANSFCVLRQPELAQSILDDAKDRVRTPESLACIESLESVCEFFRGRPARSLESARRVIDSSSVSGLAEAWALAAAALSASLLGRHDVLNVTMSQWHSLELRSDLGLMGFNVALAESSARAALGDFAGAVSISRQHVVSTAGRGPGWAMAGIVLGRAQFEAGALVSARDALRQSLAAIEESGPSLWIFLASLSLAQVQAGLGDHPLAARSLSVARGRFGADVAVFAPELELAACWVAAAQGDLLGARARARVAAESAAAIGAVPAQARALHTCTRLGGPGVARRLRELAVITSGSLVAVLADHAAAFEAGDGGALEDVAGRFETLGAPLLAAEAAAQAAAVHAGGPDRRRELVATAKARRLASRCEGARTPALVALARPLPLTAREREVAALLADGLTNRELAERLGVSVRTIEGHLYRMTSKLDVRGRKELALAASWVETPPMARESTWPATAFAWQTVGRAAVLNAARAALEPGSGFCGVVLIGDAGIGKTALARTLVAGHCGGVRWVTATDTARQLPLGAFAAIMAGDSAFAIESVPDPWAAVWVTLTEECESVVVVDDAHLLDPQSAVLVHRLALSRAARLVLTIPGDAPGPTELTVLWRDGHLLPVPVAPLDTRHVEELLGAVLGPPQDPAMAERLRHATDGNPLLLRNLIEGPCETGALSIRGAMSQPSDHGFRSPVLRDFLDVRLAELSAAEVDALAIVALAGTVELDTLRGLGHCEAIGSIERRGFLDVGDDGGRPVARLRQPILGDVLRGRIGEAATRRLSGVLARALVAYASADADHLVRAAVLTTHSDLVPDLDAILDAARHATASADVWSGERLARFVFERRGGVVAAVELGTALTWQGRGAEAEELLGSFDPGLMSEAELVRWVCTRAANLFWAVRCTADAQALVNEISKRVSGAAGRDRLRALDAWFALCAGRVADAVEAGNGVEHSPHAPDPAVAWATSASATALALSGRSDRVAPLAMAAAAAAERTMSGLQQFAIGLAQILALTGAGDLVGAGQVCNRHVDLALEPRARATVGVLRGKVHLCCGRLPESSAELGSVLAVQSPGSSSGWELLAAAFRAQAEGALGHAAEAAAAVRRAEECDGPHVAVFRPELDLARAWARAARGEVSAAAALALRAAQVARADSTFGLEALALHTAVRFGALSVARRLRALTELVDGPLTATYAAHARGLVQCNGPALDRASARFAELGAVLLAADAAAHAAMEHERQGMHSCAAASSARAIRLAAQCGGARTPAVEAVRRPLPLTAREREIAALVVSGLTNRQISEQLVISVRTVEGHVYRIFRKLAVGDRAGLATALLR